METTLTPEERQVLEDVRYGYGDVPYSARAQSNDRQPPAVEQPANQAA